MGKDIKEDSEAIPEKKMASEDVVLDTIGRLFSTFGHF